MSNEELSTSSKVTAFIEKNVKVLAGLIVVLIVFAAVAVLGSSISAKSVAKGISAVDSIEWVLKTDADKLSAEEYAAKQDKALADVEALTSKCGIVGVRANMLKAEILFQKKDFEGSRAAWVKAADSKKGAYTAPICNYNAAVCSENVNDLDSAVAYYSKAVKAEDFYLVDHAYFSLGRVNETKGDYEAAKAAYNKLNDIHPTSKWAPIAKDRIIAVEAAAKAE